MRNTYTPPMPPLLSAPEKVRCLEWLEEGSFDGAGVLLSVKASGSNTIGDCSWAVDGL